MKRNQSSTCWRLVGVEPGDERSFVLDEGDSSVGSVPSNQVVLAERSVSRYHAKLTVEGAEVRVEDLGSKNGTRVKGRVVSQTLVSTTSEVQFGKVRLRLEQVDRDDVELALVLAPASAAWLAGSEGSQLETHRTWQTSAGEVGSDWLEALEHGLRSALVGGSTVSRAEGDVAAWGQRFLGSLVTDLRLRGAALLACSSADDPVVLCRAGVQSAEAVSGLPSMAAKMAEAKAGERYFTTSDSGPVATTLAAITRSAGVPLALVFEGDFDFRESAQPLLGLLLRIFEVHLRADQGGPQGSAPRSGDLRFPAGFVVGGSEAMQAVLSDVSGCLRGDYPVLVVGETGTGKELIARLIHLSSERADQPLEAVNCAAIPADLLEAEMFGVARGAATGVRPRAGALTRAGRGTLFLDEIGELAPALQAKLLRVLQENEFRPVGGKTAEFEARVIAATNRDLQQAMAEGSLRRDLYFRLAAAELTLPPLRQRRDDIQPLLAHFVSAFAAESGKRIPGVTRRALRALENWRWPGNVRELANLARRLVHLTADGKAIDSSVLDPRLLAEPEPTAVPAAPEGAAELDLKSNIRRLERTLIERALEAAAGNRSQAARLLGIARNTLASKIDEFALRKP